MLAYFMSKMDEGHSFLKLIFYEASFYINCAIYRHNYLFWCSENSHYVVGKVRGAS